MLIIETIANTNTNCKDYIFLGGFGRNLPSVHSWNHQAMGLWEKLDWDYLHFIYIVVGDDDDDGGDWCWFIHPGGSWSSDLLSLLHFRHEKRSASDSQPGQTQRRLMSSDPQFLLHRDFSSSFKVVLLVLLLLLVHNAFGFRLPQWTGDSRVRTRSSPLLFIGGSWWQRDEHIDHPQGQKVTKVI